MACATLKRRLKLEPLHSPQCPQSDNSKRRRHAPADGGSSLPSSPGTVSQDKRIFTPSPNLTKHQVSTHIQHELKRLNRNRQLSNANFKDTDGLVARKERKLEMNIMNRVGDGKAKKCRLEERMYENRAVYQNQEDNPIFTFGQVELICKRMMKEREDQLQEMYDQNLRVKLAEQYDVFVKFTHDQMQKGAHAAYQSYLS